MAGQSGTNYIVYIAEAENAGFPSTSDFPTGYTAAGFVTSNSLTVSNPLIDTTNVSSGNWREIADDNGTRTADFTLDGTAMSDTLQQLLQDKVLDRTGGALFLTMVNEKFPTERVFRGVFHVASAANTNPNGATATVNYTFNSARKDCGYFPANT